MRKLIIKFEKILYDIKIYTSFKKEYGAFKGIYKDFQEARSNLNINIKDGYNNLDSANRLLNFVDEAKSKIFEHEYAPFFWLNNIFNSYKTNEHLKVFDFGGAYGWHFSKFLNHSPNYNITWTVCEVEEIVKLGKEKFENNKLKFTTSFEEAHNSNIFFSSGAIQYAENISLSESLNKLEKKPKHIILSRLPMQNACKKFVTLQNASTSFNPHYVFNKNDFIKEMYSSSYELVDSWTSSFDKCIIPFNRDKSVYSYSGFYFKLMEK